MTNKTGDSLQIEPEAKNLNTKFFLIQKISLFLMCVVLLGALLGFFGRGLLGSTQIRMGVLQVSYDKFVRVQATNLINIKLDSVPPNNSYIQIWISQSIFQKVSLKSINPEPFIQQIMNDKILLSFPQRDNTDRIEVTLIVEPERIGSLNGEIGLLTGEKVQFKQFIYP